MIRLPVLAVAPTFGPSAPNQTASRNPCQAKTFQSRFGIFPGLCISSTYDRTYIDDKHAYLDETYTRLHEILDRYKKTACEHGFASRSQCATSQPIGPATVTNGLCPSPAKVRFSASSAYPTGGLYGSHIIPHIGGGWARSLAVVDEIARREDRGNRPVFERCRTSAKALRLAHQQQEYR
jgi:hypothetical protein